MQILFDSTQIANSERFGFGIEEADSAGEAEAIDFGFDEADYDLLAGEAEALEALTNGHFLG